MVRSSFVFRSSLSVTVFMLLVAVKLVAAGAHAAERPGESAALSSGRASYQQFCAACHGLDGKGRGPVASLLLEAPADVTQIRRRRNGEFPQADLESLLLARTRASLPAAMPTHMPDNIPEIIVGSMTSIAPKYRKNRISPTTRLKNIPRNILTVIAISIGQAGLINADISKATSAPTNTFANTSPNRKYGRIRIGVATISASEDRCNCAACQARLNRLTVRIVYRLGVAFRSDRDCDYPADSSQGSTATISTAVLVFGSRIIE